MNSDQLINNRIIDGFDLDIPDAKSQRLTSAWLMLALGSLVVAGLLTILIVMSRTPGVQEIFPWIDFFHTALVVHVDLTVLVWFLSCAGIFWTLNSTGKCSRCGWGALWLAVIGTAVISLSPFLGAGSPLMNNYVPVLQDPIFFVGLGVFGLGFTLLVLRGLLYSKPMGRAVSGAGALRFGLMTGLVIALISVAAVVASYLGIPEIIEGQHYYELLFWGGGHTIQFTHIQLMLVAWLWLATMSGLNVKLSPRIAVLLFALG
ncbi:MAG: cytochrome C oxidase subunit I, partial [Gammaproteobacteria bacterium]|nr:cytochrome C oxidase subunit I [Gammaproteobacteria bacterium]